MRQVVNVPQAVIDQHAMVAQTYAGFLVGHPVRTARYTTPISDPKAINVDWSRPWVEPNPMPDDCLFCARLTDDDAVRRVAGFQAAIDKEVLGSKFGHLTRWCAETPAALIPVLFFLNDDTVYYGEEPEGGVRDAATMSAHPRNRRAFIEAEQYIPREGGTATRWGGVRPARPKGWATKAAPVVSITLRLKRKMCIDWNHVYTKWMAAEGLSYDFDKHEFFREVEGEVEGGDFDEFFGVLG